MGCSWLMMRLVLALLFVGNPALVTGEEVNLNNFTLCSTDANCTSDSTPSRPLTTCRQNGCFNMPAASMEVLKFEIRKPNNVYFFVSTWDDSCNPVPFSRTELNSRLTVLDNGKDQSKSESFNGIASVSKMIRASVLVIVDLSASVESHLDKIKDALESFITTLGDNVSDDTLTMDLLILGFDGREELQKMVDLRYEADRNVVEWDFGGFVPRSDWEQLKVLIQAYALPDGRDPSTNLNGAVVSGLKLLYSTSASLKYFVIFTDGTDQAQLVTNDDAISASRESDAIVFAIALPGEPDLDTLGKIGKSGTFQIDNFAQLTSEFKKIASYISFLSSNVFVFVYCSPRRGGTSEVELRFDGKDGTKYEVDTKDFDTSDGVCNQVRHSA